MRTRIFIISFFILLIAESPKAQEISQSGKFNIGVNGGVQFANLNSFALNYSPRSNVGFTAGLFGEYNFSDKLKLRLGLNFDQRNFELYGFTNLPDTIGSSYYVYQVDYGVKYLTIPVNLIYMAGSEKFKIFLQGGAYLSFLLNVSYKGTQDYYIDGEGSIDLTGTILHYGKNEFKLNGTSKGLKFVDINTPDSQPDQLAYKEIIFNSIDFGVDIFVGLLYKPSPYIGITLGPGLYYSIPRAFEDSQYDYKWQQITCVNIGFSYTLNKGKKNR